MNLQSMTLVLAAIVVAADWGTPLEINLGVTEYVQGDFEVALPADALPDAEAEARLEAIVQCHRMQKEADMAWLRAVGERPGAYFERRNAEYVGVLLAFARSYPKAEAGLTALLHAAKTGSRGRGAWNTPLRDGLQEMQATYPDAWQSHVAPLIEASMLIWSDPKDGAAAAREALDLLNRALPDADYQFPVDGPGVEALLQHTRLQPPLRAAYLEGIGHYQYRLAWESSEMMELDESHLDAAVVTFQELIRE